MGGACVCKNPTLDIEHYYQQCNIWSSIYSPSELLRTINLFNIYIYKYIVIHRKTFKLHDNS